MTKTFNRFVVVAAMAAGMMPAQRGGGPGGMAPGTGQPPGTFDPAAAIQRRVDSLATLLSLTDSQKQQATKIFTDAQTATQAVQTNITTNRQSIQDAIKKNDIATIDRASAAIGTFSGQVVSIQAKADAAFYALLTPDQQTKYDELQKNGRGRMGFPGMSGRPGGWTR